MTNKSEYKNIYEQKGVPLFLQGWWLDVVADCWEVAITKKGEHITGIWPYTIEKKAGVTLLRNPMLTPYLGPVVFYPADIKESNADRFEHETVAELIKQLPDAKVWHLAIQPGIKQAGLFRNNNLIIAAQQTFLLALDKGEETLLANMKDTMRRNIRQAEKEVTISNAAECLPDLYSFQKNTLAQKGLSPAYSFKDLGKIMDACLAHNAAALWVAKAGQEIQAIVWHVWDKQRSYYLMGGQNQEANSYRAMSALIWHVMKEAKKMGHTTFDLEGSMDEGVERFFRGFSGQRELYLVLQRNDSLLWKLKKMIRK